MSRRNSGKGGGDDSFADLVSDVQPMDPGPRRAPLPSGPPPSSGKTKERKQSRAAFHYPDPEQTLLAYRSGVPKRDFQRLRRGEPAPDARLDLHGFRAAEAQQLLTRWLRGVARPETSCALIIQGRGHHSAGEAVLREKLGGWLTRPPLAEIVIAFAPARPADGGAGATYVLIRSLS